MTKRNIIGFLSALLVLILADALWFIISLDRLYHPLMGSLIAKVPNFWAAGAFYCVYSFGLCHFVIYPELSTQNSLRVVAKNAALFGFTAYSTYDLTALAVIEGFNATIAIIDIIWGTVAGAIICLGALAITRKLAPN